jgi:hypothetical protein
MRRIADLAAQFDETAGEMSTYESFEQASEKLFLYASRLGHVRDMFKIIDEALDCQGALHAPLQEFYSQRSHILHGPRLPVHIEDGF